jgi:predicted CXXCH cytochrome family protein
MLQKKNPAPFLLSLLLAAGCTGNFGADPLSADAGAITPGATGGAGGAGSSPGGGSNPGTGGAPATTGGSSGTDARPSGSSKDAGAPPTVCATGTIPAAVQSVLATRCLACHGVTPIAGVPSSLASYGAFAAMAKSDPTRSVADVSRLRIASTGTTRMPPAPLDPLPAAELQTLEAWFDAGMPLADCSVSTDGGAPPADAAPVSDPFAVAPKCTSGTMWTGGTRGSGQMQPGEACIACHSKGEGPRFAFGGTLYPSGHEPSECDGVNGTRTAAQVVVTDSTGQTFTAPVNAAGNFYSQGRLTVTPPLHAKVVYMGRERAMASAVTSGDCNSCHSQNGAMGAGMLKAPGRVLLP